MRTFPDDLGPRATAVEVTTTRLVVHLADGRIISAPLTWYPRLLKATPEARANWRFIGSGTGLHWPEPDEDISVLGLLAGRKDHNAA